MLQQVPLGPDESPRIQALQSRALDLNAKATALESQMIPRPTPGQYQAVVAEAQRFITGVGAVQRVLGLVNSLQVSASLCETRLKPYLQRVWMPRTPASTLLGGSASNTSVLRKLLTHKALLAGCLGFQNDC